eukprot:578816-Pyramimonas_sp.AAC.1
MEARAPPDSKSGAEVEKPGGKVMGLGKHNEYDLTTNAGYRRASKTIREALPRRAVFSPPRTARSITHQNSDYVWRLRGGRTTK